jgi:hypothetical protein
MAELSKITVIVTNNNLGIAPATDDGVMGLLVQGVDGNAIAVGDHRQYFSYADVLADFGEEYDTINNLNVLSHLRDFYDEGGNGKELWVKLLSQSLTMAQMVTSHTETLMNESNFRVKIIGVIRNPLGSYTPVAQGSTVLDADVYTAIGAAQTVATAWAAEFAPILFILQGRFVNTTFSQLTLPDLTQRSDNRVAVFLGDYMPSRMGAVGLVLGRLSKNSVQRKIGAVADGAVKNVDYAYYGSLQVNNNLATIVNDNGFIGLRKHNRKAGYFFTNDNTATVETEDFSSVVNRRVIDKAIRIAYDTFLEKVEDEIQVDAQGRIDPVEAKADQADMERAISLTMLANAEISAVQCLIDPFQNILATGQYKIQLNITPVGYKTHIVVELGFRNPANS